MSGIIGVYSLDAENIMDDLFYGLGFMQHRGEEGCGMSIEDKSNQRKPFKRFMKEDELVFNGMCDFYRKERRLMCSPFCGLGHTLYESTGGLQPVKHWNELDSGDEYNFTLVMDGVLLGYRASDDQVMKGILASALKRSGIKEPESIRNACQMIMEEFEGRGFYNVIANIKTGDDYCMLAFRDPRGIKPMSWGKKDRRIFFASETVALDALEADEICDIQPGQVVLVSRNGVYDMGVIKSEKHAHCAFEWVYFAHSNSIIEGRNIYLVRKKLGKRLAHCYDLSDIDVVMCSPDSGRGIAIGLHQELTRMRGELVPFEEAAVKTQGAKRTFQMEDENTRRMAARMKFSINSELIENQNVVCCDDSIVRGTVFRDGMAYKLREAGARSITAAISCPPLKYPCIKDPKSKKFAALGMEGDVEQIGEQVARKIGVDRVLYPSIEDLKESIGHCDLCMACFSGEYPIKDEFVPMQVAVKR